MQFEHHIVLVIGALIAHIFHFFRLHRWWWHNARIRCKCNILRIHWKFTVRMSCELLAVQKNKTKRWSSEMWKWSSARVSKMKCNISLWSSWQLVKLQTNRTTARTRTDSVCDCWFSFRWCRHWPRDRMREWKLRSSYGDGPKKNYQSIELHIFLSFCLSVGLSVALFCYFR